MLKRLVVILTLTLALLFSACAPGNGSGENGVSTSLELHVIDVGKADCLLIKSGEHVMLVDAGLKSSEDVIRAYLNRQNVKGFEYVVATHPDKDHIGGMYWVLEDYAVTTFMMPKLFEDSKPYARMMTAYDGSGAQLVNPTATYSFELGETHVDVLSPTAELLDTKDENNCSIVLRLTHGSTTFLLAGDAQELSENTMLASGQTLSADVLKIGHHGSDQSTTPAFLSAVSPKLALISCGPDSDDTYPAQSTLDLLSSLSIITLRTDLNGNILAVSDGKNITYQSTT